MKQKILFALIMGSITTALVSFTLISVSTGFGHNFFLRWLGSWFISYIIAVPAILLIDPRVQALLNRRLHLNQAINGKCNNS